MPPNPPSIFKSEINAAKYQPPLPPPPPPHTVSHLPHNDTDEEYTTEHNTAEYYAVYICRSTHVKMRQF